MGDHSAFAPLWAVAIGHVIVIYVFMFAGRSRGQSPRWAVLFPEALVVGAFFWVYQVGVTVQDPYLASPAHPNIPLDIYTDIQSQDEVFHIPQAQKYCQGKFKEWDDKITTPPGLYVL